MVLFPAPRSAALAEDADFWRTDNVHTGLTDEGNQLRISHAGTWLLCVRHEINIAAVILENWLTKLIFLDAKPSRCFVLLMKTNKLMSILRGIENGFKALVDVSIRFLVRKTIDTNFPRLMRALPFPAGLTVGRATAQAERFAGIDVAAATETFAIEGIRMH